VNTFDPFSRNKEKRIAETSTLLDTNPDLRAEVESCLLNPSGDSNVNDDAPIDAGPYRAEGGCLGIEKNTKHGPIFTRLCNFTARVEQEIVLDDGAETVRMFVLTGILANGRILPPARVPAAKFRGMAWVAEQWGAIAIDCAGFSKRDQLREAIQRLSPPTQERRVFTHTGWRKIDGEWFYLTANGAVGREGLEVDLGSELAKYSLPRTPSNPREAMRASIRLLGIAPLSITVPLWAAMFRAPLASALPLDCSLWLEGPTGSFKSTLAALFLSHYGRFSETSLSAAWSSTANQLERRAFILKDAPLVIDDYAPSGLDSRELEAKAARLLRSQGNLSGRGRLRQDLTERSAFPPRGIIIGTGEQCPPGESIRARMLLVAFDRSNVRVDLLTGAQREAGDLPHAMCAYIGWLGPKMDEIQARLRDEYEANRTRVTTGKEHLRVPGVVANLLVGIDYGLKFAEELGSISQGEATELRSRCWNALLELGHAQAQSVEGERPTRRFLSVLSTLLAQGKAMLLHAKDSCTSVPNGTSLIGWQDEDFIYLLHAAAYQMVVRFCREAGEALPVRVERLMSDFRREGISDCPKDRNTLAARFGGGQVKRVLKLKRREAEMLVGESFPGSPDSETTVTDVTALGE
jgi:hypothetical protein